jgi:DNA repair protein RadA/Sms
MARAESRYVCGRCGTSHAKWSGRCDGCGEWNSLAEEAAPKAVPKGLRSAGRHIELVGLRGAASTPPRLITGIEELDRVLGGGLVEGSAILIGGDPGIGKSTLALQAAAALAARGEAVAYVSGEESVDQIRLRAARLGLSGAPVQLAAATSVGDVIATFDHAGAPRLIIVDSIQTMYVEGIESAPGSVTQLRTSAHELIRFAKRRGAAVFLIGHVTKYGQIAGPRLLEHAVDAVLYFEGERGHQFRILRAVKNRFGPADEIGVFEMTGAGLAEVANPSALFLGERSEATSGSVVFAGIEGTRPVLVEIQALVAPSSLGTPRRAVIGWDAGRLSMILAVLEARCGVSLAGNDVYLNVAGGLRISEPAADLAVATALLSALTGDPVPPHTVIFGEISLSGAIRPVTQPELRLKEAEKLGFTGACVPSQIKRLEQAGITVQYVKDLPAYVADNFASAPK